MADLVEAAELLDIEVEQFARMLASVAAHRLGRVDISDPAQAGALEDMAGGCR
jgi:hypothetical protein